jgi:hypothetical protein
MKETFCEAPSTATCLIYSSEDNTLFSPNGILQKISGVRGLAMLMDSKHIQGVSDTQHCKNGHVASELYYAP